MMKQKNTYIYLRRHYLLQLYCMQSRENKNNNIKILIKNIKSCNFDTSVVVFIFFQKFQTRKLSNLLHRCIKRGKLEYRFLEFLKLKIWKTKYRIKMLFYNVI